MSICATCSVMDIIIKKEKENELLKAINEEYPTDFVADNIEFALDQLHLETMKDNKYITIVNENSGIWNKDCPALYVLLARFAEPESICEFRDEYGNEWRYEFPDNKLKMFTRSPEWIAV